MQNQEVNNFLLLTVPSEILLEAGLKPYELLQYSVDEGKIIIESVEDTGTVICQQNCHECPVGQQMNTDAGEVTLLEFLNSLSEQQQQAALIHLSVIWAQRTGGDFNV